MSRPGAPAKHAVPEDSEELQALHRGEITLDEFLDRKVEQAVGHWRSKLSAEKFSALRDAARIQIATHPVTVELVRQATGHDPHKMAG